MSDAGPLWFLVLLVLALAAWRSLLWRPRPLTGVTRRPPLLLGHRGVRGSEPENTIRAFRAALEAGLDGVECDVQLTQDGELVLFHDERLEGATIGGATLPALKRLYPELPRLSELLELARAHPGTLLNIELKLYRRRGRGLERKVAAAVREAGLVDRVLISSFAPLALARLRLCAPELRTALLFAPEMPWPWRGGLLAGWLHVDAVHPHHSWVEERSMRGLRAREVPVNVWTVNDPDEVARLLGLGVNGIIGDDPAQLKRAAGR